MAMQTMALGCYMGSLCANSGSSASGEGPLMSFEFESDVWYRVTAVPAENWLCIGEGNSRMAPCRFAITDADNEKILIPGWVEELHDSVSDGQKKCLSLVAASQSFRASDQHQHSLHKYISGTSNDLEIETINITTWNLDGFRLYTIRSPEFEILTTDSQLPEERFPKLSNSILPEPTAINNAFPIGEDITKIQKELGSVAEHLDKSPTQSDHDYYDYFADYFGCLQNVSLCEKSSYKSTHCPAGYVSNTTEESINDINVVECTFCEQGHYQGNSHYSSSCQSVTPCKSPFIKAHNATAQIDNVCDCEQSRRFVLEKYDNIKRRFTYTNKVVGSYDTNSLDLATYLFLGNDEKPYESLCIATAGYCKEKESESQQYGLFFQYGDKNTTCYVFTTGDNGNVSINALPVGTQSPVSAASSINSQISATRVMPVSRTAKVTSEQPGHSVSSLMFFTSSVVLSPTLSPAIPANQNEGRTGDNENRTPMGVGILAGVVGTVLLVTIAVGAGLVTYYIYSRHRSDSPLAKATGSALMMSAAAALQSPQNQINNAGACNSFDNVKHSTENPSYQPPPLNTEKTLNTEYPLNPGYKTINHDSLYESVKPDSLYEETIDDSLYESIRHDSLYESIRHDSLSEPIRHDSLSEPNLYETIK